MRVQITRDDIEGALAVCGIENVSFDNSRFVIPGIRARKLMNLGYCLPFRGDVKCSQDFDTWTVTYDMTPSLWDIDHRRGLRDKHATHTSCEIS